MTALERATILTEILVDEPPPPAHLHLRSRHDLHCTHRPYTASQSAALGIDHSDLNGKARIVSSLEQHV
ncbi:hypothetical protein DPSP01_013636 [Paraphaeosphaeria sporulosa]|uniref:Uncharacterized protein n=1 Tax=Paraphaeosphaeria sporulosa TaxID=1460663 RepID=A0A177BYM8_9PLEO|nr:uncharacterized protein CC84DRAFT_1168952 [Paraphaeosphaeria sporulosa]OAG00071.1 hypothetical protein CC84DRAFT_1168952 [Paraphaeosphaeria sporulosa]